MARYLILHLTCALFLLGCGVKKDSKTGDVAVAKMEELKTSLCACKDSTCTNALISSLLNAEMLQAVTDLATEKRQAFLTLGAEAKACVIQLKNGEKTTPVNAATSPAVSAKDNVPNIQPGVAKTTEKTTPSTPKTELPALQFHVERHTRLCACNTMTGPPKGTCLKDVKSWEAKHTIKRETQKASPEMLKARGRKIREALSKIPCDTSPAARGSSPFRIAPGAKLSPGTKLSKPSK